MHHKNRSESGKPGPNNPLSLLTEDLVQLNEVPKHLQNRVHTSTAWRWTNRGVKGVKLETVSVGGKRLTSVQAINRFLERTSRS